jgi:membrane-associated PAP2 superfamily phosphatase
LPRFKQTGRMKFKSTKRGVGASKLDRYPAGSGSSQFLTGSRYVGWHAFFVPCLLALLAFLAASTGLDRAVSDFFFDSANSRFPGQDSFALELFGHQVARALVWIVWIGLVVATFAVHQARFGPGMYTALCATLLAMALGPTIVFLLKGFTGHQCPWSLKSYGGFAEYSPHWFVARAEAGRCFPSGHAAGGFSLIALYFLGGAIGSTLLQRIGLIAALALGTACSAVRVVQGAQFLSHNLWSAAIDWMVAALVFAPLLAKKR